MSLTEELKAAFSAEALADEFTFPLSGSPLAFIDSAHAEVGRLSIRDGGDRLLVRIGDITEVALFPPEVHGVVIDFQAERHAFLARAAAGLIREILADRYYFYRGDRGSGGGVLDQWNRPPRGVRAYLWSGPYPAAG